MEMPKQAFLKGNYIFHPTDNTIILIEKGALLSEVGDVVLFHDINNNLKRVIIDEVIQYDVVTGLSFREK